MILADATKFLVAFVLLLVFLWIFGLAPGGSYAALPLTLALNFLLIVGLIYPIAAVMPFVPDLYVIVENLLRVLFFVSGVFFEIESLAISDKVKAVLAHNPLAAAIGAHRAILLEHRWPEWSALVAVGLPGAIGLVAGLIVMARYDRVYPRMVLR
jgi:lipopolysaccharide transport system permease protein